ncbi:glycosyltransferase [Nisaea denitrificans]|uniref:glycosyltransferase n=1 Tax=Nisaea denitrificans TaxID=390877 RepID=UPI000419FE90|nr:glycosyltransferase [Nisaea denitrificans]
MTGLLTNIAFDVPALTPLILAVLFIAFAMPQLHRTSNRDRLIVVSLTAVFFIRYVIWRADQLISAKGGSGEIAYAWGTFGLETLALLEIAIFLLIMSRTADRKPATDSAERALLARPAEQFPSVDILIPTYNEGREVLERSIIAARGIHYPNFKVWVCDDGNGRTWLRDLCAFHDVGYIARTDRSHAKAGNINNALTLTDGEIVAIFDADFAPTRNFLLRTTGLFEDPSIGLVQTPQHFFNKDPIQTNLAALQEIPDEQRLFFDHMAPSRDAWDAAFCCGAGSIMRRSAVEAIGGVPTGSITEDLLTSLAMLRVGYRSRYLNERLASGLAPENMNAYIVQRQRWCRGAIQGLFLRQGPLGPGLSLKDRVLYFPLGWIAQHPLKLFMLLVPIIYFFTGTSPFPGLTLAAFFEIIAPLVLLATAAMMWLVPGCYVPLVSAAVGIHTALHVFPTVVASLICPFGVPFQVTPKGKAAEQRTVDRLGLGFAILIGLLTGIGLLWNGFAWRGNHDAASFNLIANLWGCLNLVICFLIGLIAIDRSRLRGEERFNLNEPSVITCVEEALPGRLVDLSATGAQLTLANAPAVGSDVELEIFGIGAVPGRVVRSTSAGVGILFGALDIDVRTKLIDRLSAGDLDNSVRSANWLGIVRQTLRNFV